MTIKSRSLGITVNFSQPGGSYIYADINGKPGCLGLQICAGGELSGSTLSAKSDSDFEKMCRRWMRSYVYNQTHV